MNTHAELHRFHSLDAVRASALLAGILLHAILSYLPGYREANWPLSDGSTSAGLGLLYFVIHLFSMSLFFLIAGFFARLLHERIGTRSLLRNRLRRIALPMIAFYFLTMPLTVVAIIWGARQLDIKGLANQTYPILIVGPPVPWGHLWFLYMLLVIYVLVLLLRAVVVQLDAQGALRSSLSRWLGRSFQFRLAPFVSMLAADWQFYLAGAIVGTAGALYLVGATPTLRVVAMGDVERALYLCSYLFAQWCATFCVIGLAFRYLSAPSARWRYLADASYWMYLIHLPIVMLLQAWMLRWPLHWSIKLALILAIMSAVLLGTYHFLVRRTFLGVFLNGRK